MNDSNSLLTVGYMISSRANNPYSEEKVKTLLKNVRDCCDAAISMVKVTKLPNDELAITDDDAFIVHNELLKIISPDSVESEENRMQCPSAAPIDDEPALGYFEDTRSAKRDLGNIDTMNFRNTSFFHCLPREWLEFRAYEQARMMPALLCLCACLKRDEYSYQEVMHKEITPVENCVNFIRAVIRVLMDEKAINISNIFGKRRNDKNGLKLEAKWAVKVHFTMSESARKAYEKRVYKKKYR